MDPADDAQANIERSARDVIRGYPLAAGLTSVADVINHLPPPRPSASSLFAHPASLSLQAGPDEPLFAQYSNEIATLLDPTPSNLGLVEQWRQLEMGRAAEALQEQVGAFRGEDYGRVFAPPPFLVNVPLSGIAVPAARTLPTQLLDTIGFPYPPFPSTSQINSSTAAETSNPVDQAASAAFFEHYLASQAQARDAMAPPAPAPSPSSSPMRPLTNSMMVATPPRPLPFGPSGSSRGGPMAAAQQLPPSSSPDPLFMSGGQPSSFNGHRYAPSPHSSSPAGASSGSPIRTHSFRLEIEQRSPKRPLPRLSLTESQRAKSRNDGDQTPTTAGDLQAGVESAVKRFKLETSGETARGGPVGSPNGGATARATVKAGEGQNIVERVSDLLSDLFACDDSFINDTSASHVDNAGSVAHDAKLFRDATTTIDGLPLLDSQMLHKLIQHLSNVHAKKKGEDLLEEAEEGGIARLLKIVERSWRGAEDLSFWPHAATKVRREMMNGGKPGKGKPKKGTFGRRGLDSPQKGRGSRGSSRDVEEEEDEEEEEDRRSLRSRSRSRSPLNAMEVDATAVAPDKDDEDVWSDDVLDDFAQAIRSMSDAVLAIRVALLALTMTSLPKALYSADYVLSILTTLRHALDALIVPLVETSSESHLSELLSLRRGEIHDTCESLSATVPLVTRLAQQEELSEEIVISTVYLSLAPFFHEAASTTGLTTGKGKKVETNVAALAMKGLRIASLGLTRTLYGRYPDQRSWIVEEVLGSLTKLDVAKKGKGAIRLRNGSSIHTVSALILHLVQTCEPDLCAQVASRLAGHDRSQLLAPVPPSDDLDELALGATERPEGTGRESNNDPLGSAMRNVIKPALDSATMSAWTVVSYLLQKSSKAGKVSSGSTEFEYRAVFDNLIADLLVTLNMPEWPAAEVLLTVCCKSMMNALADPKSTHEGNALKSVALDHLGSIGARLHQDVSLPNVSSSVLTLHEIVSKDDVDALNSFVRAQQDVIRHLVRTDKENGVAEYLAATFGADLVAALTKSTSLLGHFTPEELTQSEEGRRAKAFYERLQSLAESFWTLPGDDDVFGPSADDEQARIDNLMLQFARVRPLAGLYDSILKLIVDGSESTAVSFRTKALRGISLLVAQDPELFHRSEVRASIENRMHDGSPAVRDAAIELVGKYVITRPDLATQYLPQLSERITDTGLSVRRRVVRLLKMLYSVVEDDEQRIEICRKLVWRALDEDDGVKELAVDAVEELWFAPSGRDRSKSASPATGADQQATDDAAGKPRIDQLAHIVMAVTGDHRERPPPVDEVLRMIIAKHKERGTRPPLDPLRDVTESLIDGLLEDEGSRNIVACVKTIHVLNSADPTLLSTSKATILLPFLKSATSPQEQVVSDYLLKIFRSAVTAMPKTSSKFSKDLQSALMPMLNKPSASPTTLQEVVACYCAVVRGQTHDFAAMINVFRVSIDRLAGEVKKLMDPEKAKTVNARTLPILCFLSSLLCEHANFDQVRSTYRETREAINAITTRSVSEHVYTILVKLHQLRVNPATLSAVLTSLGFLFRAYPTLMLSPPSTSIMDAVFDSNAPQTQLQLLKIIQDFLSSQARSAVAAPVSKRAAKADTGVKIEELVGNVEGFADSGVASAISQRYIDKILAATLSTNPQVQRVAVDILTSVARSGFSHPLTIAPHLVALTTSEDSQTASKAYATLSLLYQKHASLLSTRFVEPAQVAHGFARTFARDQVVHGYRGDPPQSHFGRWYNLLQKEKRVVQLDYLKTLTRTLEVEPGARCTEDDISLVRYIAEALSTLEYKRLEEPMSVIVHLNSALAVAGLQVLHLLEVDLEGGAGLLGDATTPYSSPSKSQIDGASVVNGHINGVHQEVLIGSSNPPSPDLARQSLICGIALLLRDHLKKLYSITDAKLSKFVPGKKSAQGDRAVSRRADAPLALGQDGYERMPFAVIPLSTDAELNQQRLQYIAMIQEDGTIGALDEIEMDAEDPA